LRQDEYFKLHKSLLKQAQELTLKKNHDYASKDDALQNIKACEVLGIPAAQGLLTRLMDKLSRLSTHAAGRKFKVTDETCKDTALDIINYAVLYYALAVEGMPKRDREQLGIKRPYIVIDVDGVLAPIHEEWTGPEDFVDPYPEARAFMESLMEIGEVVIYTCRIKEAEDFDAHCANGHTYEERIEFVEAWFEKHSIPYSHLWKARGKPWGDVYIDDKALFCTGGKFPEVLNKVKVLIKPTKKEK
jgi:hypothetical protein